MNINDALDTIRRNSSLDRDLPAYLRQASSHLSQALYALHQALDVADEDKRLPLGNIIKALQQIQTNVDEMRDDAH